MKLERFPGGGGYPGRLNPMVRKEEGCEAEGLVGR